MTIPKLVKGTLITIAIFIILLLVLQFALITRAKNSAQNFQQQLTQLKQERKLKSKKISAAIDTISDYHFLLEDIGRSLFSIKNSVKEYKNQHNQWPENMAMLGLDPEKAADGKYTQSIKLDKGEIYAFLTPKYGSKKIIRLYYTGRFPNAWSCTTNLRLFNKKTIAGMPCTEDPNITL